MDFTEYKKTNIPEEFNELLVRLNKAESGKLHKNATETDITNGYGIYRAVHPNAEIFKYIDSLATNIGKPSSSWDKTTIESINSKIDPEIDRALSYLFYKEYYKNARLELFPKELFSIVTNLFANTSVGTWFSVQRAITLMKKKKVLEFDNITLSVPDGYFGKNTEKSLLYIRDYPYKTSKERELTISIFETLICASMKSHYTNISFSNVNTSLLPGKLIYLKGWINRVDSLEENR